MKFPSNKLAAEGQWCGGVNGDLWEISGPRPWRVVAVLVHDPHVNALRRLCPRIIGRALFARTAGDACVRRGSSAWVSEHPGF